MRIFVFSWRHESNSFGEPTPLEAFERGGTIPRGEEILAELAGTNTEWGGVIDRAARHGWTLIPSISAIATPSGPVTAAAAQALTRSVLEDLAAAGPVDAVFAILHGAMQTELDDDGEGRILTLLRNAVGAGVPIVVTLDPHANLTPAMIDAADLLVPYRTTPHVDKGDTGRRCADLLAALFARHARPRHVWAQPPQNDLDDGRTSPEEAPMARLLRRADMAAASDPAIAAVALFGGFPWGDIATCGPSVLVTRWDDETAGATALARDIATGMWEAREETTLPFHSLDEGLRQAAGMASAPGPVILVDYADCPAGGSPGDNVEMLGNLIERGERGFVYGIVNDAAAAAAAHRAGIDASVELRLGGTRLARFSGKPLAVTARVLTLTDGVYRRTGPVGTGSRGNMGPAALLDIAGNRVMVASNPTPVEDLAQVRHFGVEPAHEQRLFLKAMNHFRADFDRIASRYVYLESPALCSHDWALFDYRRIRRPVYPLDAAFGLDDAGIKFHLSAARS